MSDTNPSHSDAHKLCAANNADWYQSIFRARRLRDERTSAFWASDDAAPPYHGQLVTLSEGAVEAQLQRMDALTSCCPPGFGVKDSFCRLPLDRRGFRKLFDATWIMSAPVPAGPLAPGWTRVTSQTALAEWERSWQANGSPAEVRVFPDAVLADHRLRFYAHSAGGKIIGGCAINVSVQCVGLSNIFSADGASSVVAGAAACARSEAQDLPIVGYERGAALDALRRAGFEECGSLRVWVYDNDHGTD